MGGVVFTAGCLEDNDSGQVFLEVRQASTTEADARVTEYDCVKGSVPLKSSLREAINSESGEAITELTTTEEEQVRTTLANCYTSEEGPAYVRRDDALFKINFLRQQ